MKLDRPSTDDERNKLKAAFRRLLKQAGGQESAQLVTRGRHQTLNRYGNVNEPESFVALDVLLDLERDVGEPIVLSVYADMLGYELVPKARSAITDEVIAKHLGEVADAAGALFSRLGNAAARGVDRVTDADLAAIDNAAAEVRTEVAELEADVEAALVARRQPSPRTTEAEVERLAPRSARKAG